MPILYAIIYLAALGTAAHFVGNALPRQWFRADAFPYRSFAWEREGQIYRKIGIHRWKDKVPDMSKICRDMTRKEIPTYPTVESLTCLIAESCIAECSHWVLLLLSLLVLAIVPGAMGFVIYGLCVLGNLPCLLIQRYNRPRLQKALARLRRKG